MLHKISLLSLYFQILIWHQELLILINHSFKLCNLHVSLILWLNCLLQRISSHPCRTQAFLIVHHILLSLASTDRSNSVVISPEIPFHFLLKMVVYCLYYLGVARPTLIAGVHQDKGMSAAN